MVGPSDRPLTGSRFLAPSPSGDPGHPVAPCGRHLRLRRRCRAYGLVHPLIEAGLVAVFAGAAMVDGVARDVRASLATLALVMSSAIMVHLSGGTIEMHFHFFVVVAVVALYQSWMPFLMAIGFVLLAPRCHRRYRQLGGLQPSRRTGEPLEVGCDPRPLHRGGERRRPNHLEDEREESRGGTQVARRCWRRPSRTSPKPST